MENSTATTSPNVPPSNTGPPLQPEQNLPPFQLQAAHPPENYWCSKIGIAKIGCILLGTIGFGLILLAIVDGTYYNYKCSDDEKGRYNKLIFNGNISSSENECEDFIRGTYQNCRYAEKLDAKHLESKYQHKAVKCANPQLIKVPLILNGILLGVAVILLIVPAVSPNMRNNLSFLKSDMICQYVGFVIYLISLILAIVFWYSNSWSNYYPCYTRKGDNYFELTPYVDIKTEHGLCEATTTLAGITMFWTMFSGEGATLLAAVFYFWAGWILTKIRRSWNQGVAPGDMMMTGGMTGQSQMMGGTGYGSPIISQDVGGGQTMGYPGTGQMGGMNYGPMGGSPMMRNNVGMMSTQPAYSTSPGGPQPVS